MITKFNASNEKGFTLIELMIVIAIIGILAAIAIPQFSAYRARSYNAGAMSDVRNLMTAQEAYFVDFDKYASAAAGAAAAQTAFSNYGYVPSAGVSTGAITGTSTGYTIADTSNTSAGSQAVSYSVAGPGGSIAKTNP
jgi:type IV pilus assembly protein PilA